MSVVNLSNYNKVAISGAHKVGKTTLCKVINEWIPERKLIPEFARKMLEFNENSKDEFPNSTYLLECSIIYSHLYVINNLSSFISDRSIFDALSYSYYFYRKGLLTRNEFLDINEIAMPYIEDWNKFYDKILVFNLHNSYATIPDNPEWHQYQIDIDSYIKELMKVYIGEVVLINKGDVLKFNELHIGV